MNDWVWFAYSDVPLLLQWGVIIYVLLSVGLADHEWETHKNSHFFLLIVLNAIIIYSIAEDIVFVFEAVGTSITISGKTILWLINIMPYVGLLKAVALFLCLRLLDDFNSCRDYRDAFLWAGKILIVVDYIMIIPAIGLGII